MNKIIVIVGPTGVGKTKLSIALAKLYDAEIINADAVQVFKRFNIGTAKITEDEKEGIKHHFIDIKDPNEEYSVAQYQKDGRKLLEKLIKEKNVIVVGGTGLYVKALLYDYNFKESNRNNTNYDKYTNEELKRQVDNIYKENNIHKNNRKRLIRFLDEYNTTGRIIKNYDEKDNIMYNNVTFIGLKTDRGVLYKRIDDRVEEMFKKGLIDETKELYNDKIKRCEVVIGYKELIPYFENKISLDEAKKEIKKHTRNYVKRQFTWFNNQLDVNWFNVDFNNFDNTIKEVNEYIKNETK